MKKNPTPIQQAIQSAKYASNVEVIMLPLDDGHQRVLLRSKHIPEYAFLLWADHRGDTHSWLGLDIPKCPHENASYQVVCACCPTHTTGAVRPKRVGKPGTESYKNWSLGLAQKFKETLGQVCRTNGITTVFMRRANAWHQNYGEIEWFEIREALNFREEMRTGHSHQFISANTRFISRKTSEGMFND